MSDQVIPEETAADTEKQTYESLDKFAAESEFIPNGEGSRPEPEQPQLGGEEIAFILEIGFGVVASRRGDHWKLQSEEAKQLGTATDKVLQKYLPDMQTGPEVALVLTAAMVMLPRIMLDQQLAADKDEVKTDGD